MARDFQADRSGTLCQSKDAQGIDAGRLGQISSFVAVAEHLSFSDAADAIGLTSSTISRKVARLEDELGTRLFDRTTRRVTLTESGRLYLAECTRALDSLAAAEAIIESLNSEPRGLLRISVPVALGHTHLSGAIMDFMREYPEIRVDANYSDSYVNLVEGSFDVVVRTGNLIDSGMIARKVAVNRRLIVAAPSYLESAGVPQTPGDLARHDCLSYEHYSHSGGVWRMQHNDDSVSIKVGGRFRSDSSGAILDATLRGCGVGMVAAYLCYDHIRAGRLVQLFPEWRTLPEAGIYVVFVNNKHIAPKVRAFSDFISRYFKHEAWNTPWS